MKRQHPLHKTYKHMFCCISDRGNPQCFREIFAYSHTTITHPGQFITHLRPRFREMCSLGMGVLLYLVIKYLTLRIKLYINYYDRLSEHIHFQMGYKCMIILEKYAATGSKTEEK